MLNKTQPKKQQPTLKDPNRVCVICGNDYKAVAPLQKTCSMECRKIHYAPRHTKFKFANPEAHKQYNKNRVAKNPTVWKDRAKQARMKILEALGGKCIVCGAHNYNWQPTATP
jgi:predicted nucleic acid-binding Zn ribbon protein